MHNRYLSVLFLGLLLGRLPQTAASQMRGFPDSPGGLAARPAMSSRLTMMLAKTSSSGWPLA